MRRIDKKSAVVMVAAVVCALPLFAKIEMGTPFSDGVVLQRERPVPIWGTAEPGSVVTVRFAGASASAAVSSDRTWKVELPAMAASKESRVMTVTEGAGETIAVRDVLVGEVWMCAGQSNTDCPIWGSNPRYRDGWGAMMLTSVNKPFVRLVKTPLVASEEPRTGYRVEWLKMTPDLYAAFQKGVRMPSAMGYYYALELANALDIPIGLVDSSWGGTNIETWTPRSGYEGLKDLDADRDWKIIERKDWKPEMKKGAVNAWHKQPRVLWNGMVAAYAPMACRGFIWYQGCSNADEYPRYANKMHALYNGWAKEFANPNLKLYFVQLAPWGNPSIANIQMAQAQFAAEEKNAEIAIINDVGNLKDIHPNDKRTVAKRLSLHALRRDYGWASVMDRSPTLKSWRIDGDRFILSFNDAVGWYVYNPDRSTDVGFEICGADGVWKPGKIVNIQVSKDGNGKERRLGTLNGADVIVAAEGVTAPTKLRYLHSAPWFGALYSDACLPLGAFAIENAIENK